MFDPNQDFPIEMASALVAAGFTDVVVNQHRGRAPNWQAYGYDPQGRHKHATFYGSTDWRAALTVLNG